MTDTTDVVQRARQALDGITPGPWERRTAPLPGESKAEYLAGTCADNAEPLQVVIAPSPEPEFAYIVPAVTGDGPASVANASFIAAAPDLVRELADELDRTREALADERVTVIKFQQEAADTLNLDDNCGPDELADAIRVAQAWAAWFAAKARWLTNNQIGRVKRSNKKLRAESVNLRNQQSRTMSERARLRTERDELRATLDRVRAEVPFLSARDQILIRAALDQEEQS